MSKIEKYFNQKEILKSLEEHFNINFHIDKDTLSIYFHFPNGDEAQEIAPYLLRDAIKKNRDLIKKTMVDLFKDEIEITRKEAKKEIETVLGIEKIKEITEKEVAV